MRQSVGDAIGQVYGDVRIRLTSVMRSVIVDLPHRPNQVEFAAPSGISGDGEESMVNCPQKIGNQCGSVVKSTWSKVWLGRHDDEYKRSKSGKTRGGKKL